MPKGWIKGEKVTAEFHDDVLGTCRFNLDSFYLTNDMYGGYGIQCTHGSESVDYADPFKVLMLAVEVGATEVHLAGNIWERVGREGWGEKVPISEAGTLLEKLSRLRK